MVGGPLGPLNPVGLDEVGAVEVGLGFLGAPPLPGGGVEVVVVGAPTGRVKAGEYVVSKYRDRNDCSDSIVTAAPSKIRSATKAFIGALSISST
ncbi:MAG: hypothetical protein A2855_00410 [Candidatus Liptonbacteria bacterium RIFCSPHIGHO2_01_FULL_57_28]|uniref:Uncharacterized protein n=1 Tax=Candidatus Liptonbacteria bacterium RIFCSPHIGHO2_01_FULL_57_28 TaxID=1798647 RepID=A0A1G2C8I7_9BACT|nr:MAG: hypothetical protein A2855_00410 [Candidatus Liptonbacteria bacterium RIFCSPHIGHO2_01_FULL_57_28]